MNPGDKVLTKFKNRFGYPCIGLVESVDGDHAHVKVLHVGALEAHQHHRLPLEDLKPMENDDDWHDVHDRKGLT